MSQLRAPEVATPRAMAQTLGVFFLFGGLAALLAVRGAGSAGTGREVIVCLALVALGTGAVALRFGARWSRACFHVPLVLGAGLIVTAVLVSPDRGTALVCGMLISFVVLDGCIFFGYRQAALHVTSYVSAVTAALLLRGDVALGTALALDVATLALGIVTRALVIRASGASRDPLTDLRNRRGLDDSLRELMITLPRTGERLSAALLDLDHFKTVNDTHGHDAGDRLLREVADMWRSGVPRRAVLARHGGDEFALILPGFSGPAALELVRRVCDRNPDIRLSCGVAEYVPGDSAAQLMRRADQALYAAKAAGRGRAELAGGASAELARDLSAALAVGDVVVAFQPIVQISTGTVVGVEALARWTHLERGTVSPAEFVAVAEQYGLIPELGEQVMRSTCSQLVAMYAETGRRLRVGINVSGIELCDPAYPDRVRAVLADTGWPASEIILEVTESLLEADSATAVEALHALRAMGMKVAVDDFGTGYSSLSRLDTLPVDILKVDSSFIATITSSPRRALMLASIVGLAGALQLDVVAEGVETAEQDAMVRDAGCSFAQGWLHGRPMPLAELVASLGERVDVGVA